MRFVDDGSGRTPATTRAELMQRLVVAPSLCLSCVAALVLSLSLPASAQSSEAEADPMADQVAQGMIVKALTAQRIGRIDNAITYAQSALMVLKDDPEVLSILAGLHRDNGDLETALYFARQAMNFSGDSRFAIEVARFEIENGQVADAEVIVNRLVAAEPDAALPRFVRATIYTAQSRTSEAIADLRAIETNLSGTGVDYGEVVDLCSKLRDNDCAIRFGRAWLDAAPTNVDAQRALTAAIGPAGGNTDGLLTAEDKFFGRSNTPTQSLTAANAKDQESLVVDGNSDASEDSIRTLLTTYPLNLPRIETIIAAFEARLASGQLSGREIDTLIRMHLRSGRVRDALRVGAPALATDVTSQDRWALVAEAQRRSGLLDQSALTCSDGLLFFPAAVEILIECAVTAIERGDMPTASRYLVDAVKHADISPPLEPVEARLQAVSAVATATEGNRAASTQSIASAVRISPDPFVLVQVARAYQLLNSPVEATSFAKRALALDSQNDEIQFDVGRIYFSLDMYDEARDLLEMSSDQQENNSLLFEMLGDTASKRNDADAARAAYTKVIALDPTNSAVKKKLDALRN